MAISFPITAVTNSATNVNPTFTLGTAPATDDIIVVFITTGATAITQTDVSGWTNVLGADVDVDSDANQGWMCWHRVTSGESGASTVTWTLSSFFGSSTQWRINAAVLRGVDATTAVSGSAGSGFDSANAATPWVIPTVTPADNNSVVIAGIAGDGTETQTTPGGWSLLVGTGTTFSTYLYSRDTLGSSGVPTGTTNVTPSGGNEYVAIAQAFKAAVVSATDAPAGNAAGTGAANNPTTAGASIIGHAAGTGTANNPGKTVASVIGHAAGTGTANNPLTSGSSIIGHAAGTGAANNPGKTVAALIGHAAGTGTAYNPTVSTAAATNAAAGHASGIGTAYGPSSTVAAVIGHAAGTGAAYGPTLLVQALIGQASGTGTAYNPQASIVFTTGHAAGTGTAYGPKATIAFVTGHAAGTGTAFDAVGEGVGFEAPPLGVVAYWREPGPIRGRDPSKAGWREPAPTRGGT